LERKFLVSTRANILFPPLEHEVVEAPIEGRRVPAKVPDWDAGRFADQQIRRLVRQVFFPGWPKPARQVVVAAVDEDSDVAGICLNIGQVLTQHVEGRVGVIETTLEMPEFEDVFGVRGLSATREGFNSLRSVAHQIDSRLWLVPPTSFWGTADRATVTSLENTIGQVRHEFDYAVLHASPAAMTSEAAVFGHMCDGVILVLEAHTTHRVVAQKVKETLQAANVRVLGAVLSGRTFPIPEKLYERL
jgi:Mrp family chromosome partitioning ATPase